MKSIAIFFLLFTILINVQSQDSLLVEYFKTNHYPFQFENEQLSGDGLEFLTKIGEQTSFFLIGEDHGIAENPLFTAALFRIFKPHGYQYFATETGPYTADYLQKKASEKDMYQQLQTLYQDYPASIPFYNLKEECSILEAVVNHEAVAEKLIWGLDQEFAASPRMHFKYLIENAQTKDSRELALEYHDMAVKAYQESATTRNPAKAFMAIVQPSDFERMKNVFKHQEDNLNLIRELEESIYIYQLWFQREGYESNRLRAEMMKRHFWQYYSEAKKQSTQPKVMFKFGANHIYRGANGLNVFDIGNFVSELASQEETSSFHLYSLGRKGTQNRFTPFSKSEADKKKKYDPAQYLDKVDFSTVLAGTPETTWSIVDLRPLRKKLFSHSINDVHPGLEKVIWSYDAILVIPEVTAATNFE